MEVEKLKPLRCPWCTSTHVNKSRANGHIYCHSCFRKTDKDGKTTKITQQEMDHYDHMYGESARQDLIHNEVM